MKAVRFHEHGGLDVLRCEEVPDPEPAPGEVLVRVRACALNHLDLWQRRGIPGVPLPHCPGTDIAGEVVRGEAHGVGEGVRVLLQPGISCGRCIACLNGQDNLCRSFGLIGHQSEGGYAEFVTVPVENVVPIPDGIGFVEAAAFPLTFLSAWHMLVTRAQLRPGETVLILAAGSGVGQAAIQVARAQGARIIVTAGSAEKLERAKALGAHEGIDHYQEDVAREVRRFTDRRGVDVVFEHVGQATWEQSTKSLRRGGAAGHLRRHHRPRRVDRHPASVHAADLADGMLRRIEGGVAPGGRAFLRGPVRAGRRPDLPAGGGRRGPAPGGGPGAVRKGRPAALNGCPANQSPRFLVQRNRMSGSSAMRSLARISVSIVGVVGVLAVTVAAATIWLLLTDPVTVADAVNEQDVTPLVRELATVIYEAIQRLIQYL